MNKYLFIIFSLLSIFISACEKESHTPGFSTSLPSYLELDASCQVLEIPLGGIGNWRASTDCKWLTGIDTLGKEGESCRIYIEQNDGPALRKGKMTVYPEKGEAVDIFLDQLPIDSNGWEDVVKLPHNFGIGWGYDAKTEVADISGVRGQIFNAEELKKVYKNNKASVALNSTGVSQELIYDNSAEAISKKISTTVYGEIDLKAASVKIEGEYAQQISEKKNRLYVWYRDWRQVKVCYITVDIRDKNRAPQCFTSQFSKCISDVANGKMTPAEFVKTYGTHLIQRSFLGGKMDYYFTVSNDIKEKVETITLTVSVKFLGIKKSSSSVKENTWIDIKKDFIGNFYVKGGGGVGADVSALFAFYCNRGEALPEIYSGKIEEWQKVFSNPNLVNPEDLTLVNFYVQPIWDIVKMQESEAAEKIEKYIREEYLR